MPESVSAALWEDGHRRETARLASAEAGPEALSRLLDQLDQSVRGRRPERSWFLVEAACPADWDRSDGKTRLVPLVPPWIRRCWERLPARHLPDRFLEGTACLEAALRAFPECQAANTVLCFLLESHWFLVAHGDCGTFQRSLKADLPAGETLPATDWWRQSQALYRARSGTGLSRVLVAGSGCAAGFPTGEGLPDFVPTAVPESWQAFGGSETGLQPLHAGAASCGQREFFPGSPPELHRRLRRRSRERLFRGASLWLSAVSLVLGMAACRQTVSRHPDESARLFEQETRIWEHQHLRWHTTREKERAARSLEHLVGQVAATLPAGFELERIGVARTEPGSSPGLRLDLEGRFPGSGPTEPFRGWLDRIRREVPLQQTDSLEFQPRGDWMAFSLRARKVLDKE